MNHESVRIGIAIREAQVRFALPGGFHAFAGSQHAPLNLSGSNLTASVAHPSDPPVWSARLHSFVLEEEARQLIEVLRKHGCDAWIQTMGREVAWTQDETVQATIWSVLAGKEKDRAVLEKKIRKVLDELPTLENPPKGWKRYDDQQLGFDVIRTNPPQGGRLSIEDESGTRLEVDSPLRLESLEENARFELADVRIGIDFHWDHHETLRFRGAVELIVDGEDVTVVNELDLDQYLASVLGSEMRPDWPIEALAAQAVAARSTVLATRGRHHYGESFDLCHDDHCQDYQGVSREGETAMQALERSRGWLLAVEKRVLDARFAKTCGGITDTFSTAWDDCDSPGLTPALCAHDSSEGKDLFEAGKQGKGSEVLKELLDSPPKWAACNPAFHSYPESVSEMEKLYRWQRRLGTEEIAKLVRERTGCDLGAIHELEPLSYGVSGRIIFLRVRGAKGSVTVGKELAVRRLLSQSHLPSSAFCVRRDEDGTWVIDGIGWGHGVGLCQMGASALAGMGWKAEKLLQHYYPGSRIVRQ